MSILQEQNDFTHGQFDRILAGRSDNDLYRKAAKRIENFVVVPGGAAKRRFGTKLISSFPEIGVLTPDQYQMEEFQYTEDESYLFIFLPDRLQIYLNDLLIQQIFGSDGYPYIGSQISSLNMAQTSNLMVIAHPDVAPYQVYFDTTTNEFVIEIVPFNFVPAWDFRTYSYAALTFTLGSAAIGTTTLTSSSAIFTDAHVGGAFISLGNIAVNAEIGYAQIISRTDPGGAPTTTCSVHIISPFGATSNLGNNSKLLEKAWSDVETDMTGNRGWPRSVTFFQGRLWFGGSRSLPDVIFGSAIANYSDFCARSGEADQAIIEPIASRRLNTIRYIVGSKSLQVFTQRSEWSTPIINDQPIEPGNVSLQNSGDYGIANCPPIILDNVTFYAKQGGKGVRALLFEEDSRSFQSENVSVISSDVIRNPIDSAVLTGSETDDADYLFLINSDGTLAVYQTLREQEVSAWTISNTLDKPNSGEFNAIFKRIQEIGNNIYFLVQRTIDNEVVTYLEKLDFDYYTDCTIDYFSAVKTNTIIGLSRLENQKVQILASQLMTGPWYVVNDTINNNVVTDGQLDISEDIPDEHGGFRYFRVGIQIKPLLETMPIVVSNTQQGSNKFIPKRVNRVFVQYLDSLGIKVNGISIPNLELGDTFTVDSLSVSHFPKSGEDEVYLQEYSVNPTITITQDDPLPMTILSIGYEVST